jgi:hypothetical protein
MKKVRLGSVSVAKRIGDVCVKIYCRIAGNVKQIFNNFGFRAYYIIIHNSHH